MLKIQENISFRNAQSEEAKLKREVEVLQQKIIEQLAIQNSIIRTNYRRQEQYDYWRINNPKSALELDKQILDSATKALSKEIPEYNCEIYDNTIKTLERGTKEFNQAVNKKILDDNTIYTFYLLFQFNPSTLEPYGSFVVKCVQEGIAIPDYEKTLIVFKEIRKPALGEENIKEVVDLTPNEFFNRKPIAKKILSDEVTLSQKLRIKTLVKSVLDEYFYNKNLNIYKQIELEKFMESWPG